MLPQFYQNHLKSQLSYSEYLFLKILLHLVQSIKKVNLERLANALPLAIKFQSRRKRIQRFLSLPNLTIEKIWFSIVKELASDTNQPPQGMVIDSSTGTIIWQPTTTQIGDATVDLKVTDAYGAYNS